MVNWIAGCARGAGSGAGVWLVAALLVGCRGGGTKEQAGAGRVLIGDVAWYVDYDTAVQVARAQDKALWVHFGENPG